MASTSLLVINARLITIPAGTGLEMGKFAEFVVVDPLSPDFGPVRSYVLAVSLRNLKRMYAGVHAAMQWPGALSMGSATAAMASRDDLSER
ncbi:MAG: cytosine deaminase [Microbacterium sp.]|uniref:hypothetical protein n=1 Tax=Microbacterium sp. TaxID=51671 RepID=UPI00261FBFA2|nr:hypothetical protein [Microbacterium sp.]MDF2560268.1 cytosine deaminase [Microbacterium sp.]